MKITDVCSPTGAQTFPFDVSVIVPTYGDRPFLKRCLASLAAQSFDIQRFEVLLVVNGQRPFNKAPLDEIFSTYPDLNVRIFRSTIPSASIARNIGMQASLGEYITFVDDDDEVEHDFLSNLFSEVSPDTVTVAGIMDVEHDGKSAKPFYSSDLGLKIRELSQDEAINPEQAVFLARFNSCKLVHRNILLKHRFDPDLLSGEDVVFWVSLFATEKFKLKVLAAQDNTNYIRHKVASSVSRKNLSFDFNVAQRIAVIRKLLSIPANKRIKESLVIPSVKAQTGFINRYIEEFPTDYNAAIKLLLKNQIDLSALPLVAPEDADTIAFLYCFAPFADTSAIVAGKVLNQNKHSVDVISCDLSTVRQRDPSLYHVTSSVLRHHTILKNKPSFADWILNENFARSAVKEATKYQRMKNKPYKHMYSRSFWVGSHLAALQFKLKNPNVLWNAEFSDPTTRSSTGEFRTASLGNGPLWKSLLKTIRKVQKNYHPYNMFDVIEYSTVVLADKLCFTNVNQLKYMAGVCPFPAIRDLMIQKAIIRAHPVPAKSLYYISDSDYSLNPNKKHIGYFGNFYSNRSLSKGFSALKHLTPEEQSQLEFHIFTSQPEELSEEIRTDDYPHITINVSHYIPYLEMLNLCTRLDLLIVNDVTINENLPINPFLPSKLSDYLGSNTPIWAITEPKTALTKRNDVHYQTRNDSQSEILRLLRKLI
ncbi:MAG: glycosyltransferase [Actinomycetaceae bacterium]|nr:glycosyltransferase [Actinomycetaceae bacterium]